MQIICVAGDRVTILLGGEATNGQYTIMEAMVPPNGGPPRHCHHREDESFVVLAGQVTFYVGETTTTLTKGGLILAPRGIPHQFKNTGTTEAVLLEVAYPAGIERFFEAAGHPLPDRDSPPTPPTREEIAHMIAIAPLYGIDILTPA